MEVTGFSEKFLPHTPKIGWWLLVVIASAYIPWRTGFFDIRRVTPFPQGPEGGFLTTAWTFHILSFLFSLSKLWGYTIAEPSKLKQPSKFVYDCLVSQWWWSLIAYLLFAIGLYYLWRFAIVGSQLRFR